MAEDKLDLLAVVEEDGLDLVLDDDAAVDAVVEEQALLHVDLVFLELDESLVLEVFLMESAAKGSLTTNQFSRRYFRGGFLTTCCFCWV